MPLLPLKQPNIVWIVLDTHRFDRFGVYGYPRGTTPNLDAFALQATLFESAIAPAQWTVPSHASMFTGEAASTHLTIQFGRKLDPYFRTAGQWLHSEGYINTGISCNPLVGVLNNGLTRGFDRFFNYGGAIPYTPAQTPEHASRLLTNVQNHYKQLLRQISNPIQNSFAHPDKLLSIWLRPAFVALWNRFGFLKGDTRKSITDAINIIKKELVPGQKEPRFLFINLMETHLPLNAPQTFLSRFAPVLNEERLARDFMRLFNTQMMRWMLPLDEPFTDLEAMALSEAYDAEVAYQDFLLAGLLEILLQDYQVENTAVIITADHGEMLGEHQLMGHGFGVHEELVHVPLIIRAPGQKVGHRVSETISTSQLFHTLLDLAQVKDCDRLEARGIQYQSLSLKRLESRNAPHAVMCESFPPEDLIKVMRKKKPKLMETLSSGSIFRTAYNQAHEKLVQKEGEVSHYYHISSTGYEEPIVPNSEVGRQHPLSKDLECLLDVARRRRPQNLVLNKLPLKDEQVRTRLRMLGYLE